MPKRSRHDFSSLSVRDLLDAREAYHVHLAHLETVFATAIGRYLIRNDDPNASDSRKVSPAGVLGPRTLSNSSPQDWSWPCVLVFVDRWIEREEIRANPDLAQELVPSFLYLPDGRVVPTCVVVVTPETGAPAPRVRPEFANDMIGGGYPVEADVQGVTHVGSIGCLVTDGDSVYALTNRHVAGASGRPILSSRKSRRRLGVSDERQLRKLPFSEVYPGWPGEHVVANLDAGLIRVDDVKGWTAQVYGIGQIGALWDLNADSFRLDIINCPLIAHGGASGIMKGRVLGLFYRYKSVGGIDYTTDILIAPREENGDLNNAPGNSGTLWFEDDPEVQRNAAGALIRRPVALEWGGQMLGQGNGANSIELALGICLSTICREFDVELISDWNAGHTEYWGFWGHVKIGAYATSLIDDGFDELKAHMTANADNIGLDDALLKTKLEPVGKGEFAPLADVADLVWRYTRHDDESNHFADMDKKGAKGKSLLDLCAESDDNVTPAVWNDYYDGIGEDRRGALPFRVWQIFDAMVAAIAVGNMLDFVCAAGIVAHYVGDACQPLHISQFHHGRDPSDKTHAAVHSVYETNMVSRHGADLVDLIPAAQIPPVDPVEGEPPAGHDAAVTVVRLMQRTVKALPPLSIVDLFDANRGRGQVEALWSAFKEPTAARMQDGSRTLARIWEAAWTAGMKARGKKAKALEEARAFTHEELQGRYMDKSFLPAFTLQNMVVDEDGHIVRA